MSGADNELGATNENSMETPTPSDPSLDLPTYKDFIEQVGFNEKQIPHLKEAADLSQINTAVISCGGGEEDEGWDRPPPDPSVVMEDAEGDRSTGFVEIGSISYSIPYLYNTLALYFGETNLAALSAARGPSGRERIGRCRNRNHRHNHLGQSILEQSRKKRMAISFSLGTFAALIAFVFLIVIVCLKNGDITLGKRDTNFLFKRLTTRLPGSAISIKDQMGEAVASSNVARLQALMLPGDETLRGFDGNYCQEYKIDNATLLLLAAACDSSRETLKYLVNSGSDVNAKDLPGWTPLVWAAFQGNKEVVDELVILGATLDEKTESGNTALTLAANNGHYDIVKYLESKGASLDGCKDIYCIKLRKTKGRLPQT